MPLQIQVVVYLKGYNGEKCPKYVTKNSLLYKNYLKGKSDKIRNVPLKYK